jgi:hypothetical protein
MREKIVGYKLKDFVDRFTVDRVLKESMSYYGDILLSGVSKPAIEMTKEEKSVYFTRGHVGGSLVQRMRDLKVLDIWFEPIYESQAHKI